MFEHLSEFNERYEILANEISDLKNVVMGLQSYTMNVNKILFEEKIKPIVSMSTHTSTNTDNVDVSTALVNDLEPILQTDTQNEVENTVEEPILTSIVDSIVEDENSNQALDDQPDITIIAKSQKKKGSNKKSHIASLEQE
jgi:hypothetical protein